MDLSKTQGTHMKSLPLKKSALVAAKLTTIATLSFAFSNTALANTFLGIVIPTTTCTLDCGHWYVGGNIGVSHLFDKESPGSGNSVDENGPGGSVVGGYQFNSILGGEVGYTKYHDSRETSGSTVLAKTEHYAVHLAATGRYPLVDKLSVLGKLGVAYSYAQKVFTSGGAGSAGSVSPYYGVGFAYCLTPRVDFIGQWARAQGNNYTGSADLYSVGVNFAIV